MGIIGLFLFFIFLILGIFKDIKINNECKISKSQFLIQEKQVNQMRNWLEHDFLTTFMNDLNIDLREQQKIIYELSLYILHKDKEYFVNKGYESTIKRILERQGSINFIDFSEGNGKFKDLQNDLHFDLINRVKYIIETYYEKKINIYGIDLCNSHIQYYLKRYLITEN